MNQKTTPAVPAAGAQQNTHRGISHKYVTAPGHDPSTLIDPVSQIMPQPVLQGVPDWIRDAAAYEGNRRKNAHDRSGRHGYTDLGHFGNARNDYRGIVGELAWGEFLKQQRLHFWQAPLFEDRTPTEPDFKVFIPDSEIWYDAKTSRASKPRHLGINVRQHAMNRCEYYFLTELLPGNRVRLYPPVPWTVIDSFSIEHVETDFYDVDLVILALSRGWRI